MIVSGQTRQERESSVMIPMKILSKLDGQLTIFVPNRVWLEDNVLHFVDSLTLNSNMERKLIHFRIEILSDHLAKDALMNLFETGKIELTFYDVKYDK